MGYTARIALDSINTSGNRLTTFVVTFPKFVLAEFNTHRTLSRNSASSRAIPTSKIVEAVKNDPVMPVWWGKNVSGMQAPEEIASESQYWAQVAWLYARDEAVASVRQLQMFDVHKQICNRLLGPWMWTTVIVSATEWDNFFHLRCVSQAQPEIRKIAEMMLTLYRESKPTLVEPSGFHIPLLRPEDTQLPPGQQLKVSVARCARISYLLQDTVKTLEEDCNLHDRLMRDGHFSPFEHQAWALEDSGRSGNFIGWQQYRKVIPEENYTQES